MFARPGVTTLRDQASADVAATLGYPTLLRRSPLRALAYALAGMIQGVYGYLDWISRQSVPFSATGLFLEAWAGLVGVTRKPPTAARGLASFVGIVGAVVPGGVLLRAVGGGSYTTDVDLVLTGTGAGAVAITATVPGSAYTLDDGAPLSLAAILVSVQSAVTAARVAPGTDIELDDPFRTRMLLRWAQPPQGGAASDYIQWAMAVAGVTRAWDNPLGAGAGTVVVYTMWDVAEAAHLGFPQGTNGVAAAETRDTAATGDQLVVANALHPLRPATALVYHCAPIPFPVAMTFVTRSIVPAWVQALALAALDAVFVAEADPLGGVLDTDPFADGVRAVTGMPKFSLTVPAGEFSAPLGYLPIRGPVTWTAAGA